MNQRTRVRPSARRSGVLPGLVALGLVLSACGSSEPETASEASPSPSVAASEPTETDLQEPQGPQCSEVWVADEQMPDPYKGCFDGETFVDVESQRCAFGAKLFTYDDRFYAAQFNKINQTEGLADSPAYQKALEQCGG